MLSKKRTKIGYKIKLTDNLVQRSEDFVYWTGNSP